MYLNNLQTFIFATILSFLLIFVACSKNQKVALYSQNTENIKPGEKISFGEGDDLVEVYFESLNDSRCPTNVDCVRAGDAVVNLILEDSKQNKYNTTLTLGEHSDFKPDTVEVNINKKALKIILENILPYPEAGKETEKSATFHFYSL